MERIYRVGSKGTKLYAESVDNHSAWFNIRGNKYYN